MLGLSNVAIAGIAVGTATAAAVTVATVNGVFDPYLFPDRAANEARQEATQSQPAEQPAEAAQETGTETQAATAPAQDEADDKAAAITPARKPTVDIVRVEPSGDAVIAGQSDPGAIVAVLSNGEIVGKGVANDTGDWAIVMEQPLKPGSHDIAVESRKTEDADPIVSDDRIAVHVPKDSSEGVLVATNRPDAPTELVQVPEANDKLTTDPVEKDEGEPAEQTIVAQAPAEPVAQGVEESEPILPVTEEQPAEPEQAEIASVQAPSGSEEAVAPNAEPVAEPAQANAKPTEPSAEVEVATADPLSRSLEVKAQDETKEAGTDLPTIEPGQERASQAGITREPVAKPAATAVQSATLEPVQQEVRREEPAAEPESEPKPLTVARAEPQAEPETEAQAVAAPAVKPVVEDKPVSAAETPEPKTEKPVEAKPEPQPEPSVTVEAVEAEAGKVFVAGQSSGKGPVRVYIEDKYVGETKPNDKGQWLLTAPKSIEAGKHNVRADKVKDKKGTVTARAEVVFEREDDEVALKPIGVTSAGASGVAAGAGGDAGRRQIPALIIRKGDNLWRISRRHYGQGVRYTTIYQANKGQIRNPNMIFPGQVFLLPQRDINWAASN